MERVPLALTPDVVELVFVLEGMSADHAKVVGAPAMPYVMADVVVCSKHHQSGAISAKIVKHWSYLES